MSSWPAANGMSGSSATPIATVTPSGTNRSTACAIDITLVTGLLGDGFQVGAVVALELGHRVATELLENCLGHSQRHYRLADDAGRRDDAHVAALVVRLGLLFGVQVDGTHGLFHRGDRLDGHAKVDRLAVGHATSQAAGAIREVLEAPALVVDLVVEVRPRTRGPLESRPELDALHGVDGQHRLRQAPVELAVPVDVAPQAYRNTTGDDAKRPPERVAPLRRVVDGRHHAPRRFGVGAANGRRFDVLDLHGVRAAALEPDVDGADRLGEAEDLDAEVAEQLARDASGGNARGGLARGRALEHVADVGVAVLQGTREVGVPRTQAGHNLGLEAFLGGGHLGGPVDVVLVLEDEHDGAADRVAAAHAADDPGDVGLDLLPAATAVASLATRKVAAEVVLADLKPGRQSLDDDRQLWPMWFARGQETQHSGDHRAR